MPDDTLARLAELERRYDGPVPDNLRLAAHLGSAAAVELMVVAGELAFWKSLALRQIDVIRRRRADGSFYESLVDDLRTYRDGWRRWNRRSHRLRAASRPPPA